MKQKNEKDGQMINWTLKQHNVHLNETGRKVGRHKVPGHISKEFVVEATVRIKKNTRRIEKKS
jgi:ribosomal protein L9